jgi:hypothetical protein
VVDGQALSARLNMIKTTLNLEPETAFAKLADDMIAADESRTKYRDELQALIGQSREALKMTNFPAIPHPKTLDDAWRTIFRGVSKMIGYGTGIGKPLSPSLPPGYLAARIDDLLDNQCDEGKVNELTITVAGLITTPCEVQMFLSALICRWAFVSPEPMCGGQLPLQTIGLYENIRLTGMCSTTPTIRTTQLIKLQMV